VNLACVAPDEAQKFWPFARSYVEAAARKLDLSDPVQIEFEVITGRALLWLAMEDTRVWGAVITQFEDNKRVCKILCWGSDDHDRCASLLTDLENFAKAEGCMAMRLTGRLGWIRKLPDYRKKAVVLEKAL
jgi:hypothetical protein